MAKPASFLLFAFPLLLCVLVTCSSVPDQYYLYAHPASTVKDGFSTHFVSKRDVESTNSSNITTEASNSTSSSAAEKKPTFVLKKDGVDQFPDTKEPYTHTDGVSVKPSKYDKYGKGDKKPLGKPGEKPALKPQITAQENSSTSGSQVEVSTPSTTASTRPTVPVASVISNRDNSSVSSGAVDDIAKEDDSPLNITGYSSNSSITDHHRYYNSFAFSGEEVRDHLWVDLQHLQNASESELLSSAHRQAFVSIDVSCHQLGRLVSESACEREDPGSNPAADMVDAARNTAWDLGKQPNNYRSNYPTQE
ncbi:hypothetical protein FHG87_007745 [Trinorchestia longiramus]|nr:hypothetical protein FHG87_007745 [Trinorchestia longiramus]